MPYIVPPKKDNLDVGVSISTEVNKGIHSFLILISARFRWCSLLSSSPFLSLLDPTVPFKPRLDTISDHVCLYDY